MIEMKDIAVPLFSCANPIYGKILYGQYMAKMLSSNQSTRFFDNICGSNVSVILIFLLADIRQEKVRYVVTNLVGSVQPRPNMPGLSNEEVK